jgi:HlyD family secretion protein
VDIPRKSQAHIRLIRRIISGFVIIAAIIGISWYVSKLEPADPPVDRDQVYIDTVKRGNMDREVRGLGKLVPEEIRWVTAATSGRVERKLLEAGARVTPDTILIELSNPELEQQTLNAEWDLKSEESSFTELKIQLESDHLGRTSEMSRLKSDYEQAKLEFEAQTELFDSGLISRLVLNQYKTKVEQQADRIVIEEQRLSKNQESIEAKLSQKQTSIKQRHEAYKLIKSQLDQLKVRAGVAGVLQQISVEIGGHVGSGTNLARIANPDKLKAELNIPETQAKDIQVGQEVSIDARNDNIIPGRVSRIDPAVKDGTVTVDVELPADLPKGARPDLSVDGTILLERLEDIVYVGIPVQGQQDSTIGLFKLDPDGKRAVRVPVKLGRRSVSTIEIKEGLKPGEQVILSDMTAQDGFDRIRLN